MTNYVVNVTQGQSRTAGSKAKQDVVYFLQKIGYQVLDYSVSSNRFLRVLTGFFQWKTALRGIKKDDFILYQYPAYSRFLGDRFVIEARKQGARIAILLHDVNSLRMYRDAPADQQREIDFLNQFDQVIAHNDQMKQWLVAHGVKSLVVPLKIFDYQADYQMNMLEQCDFSERPTVAYTGNLAKSVFLQKLALPIPIGLYGIAPAPTYPQNITYHGSFDAVDLGDAVQEEFGLVWDGNSIDTCTGVLGEYLQYNNPHKTSFYLSKGMPVIIWKKAALARFVEEYECGITVESLGNLDQELYNLTKSDRKKLQENAIKIGQMIRRGDFLKQAIRQLPEI